MPTATIRRRVRNLETAFALALLPEYPPFTSSEIEDIVQRSRAGGPLTRVELHRIEKQSPIVDGEYIISWGPGDSLDKTLRRSRYVGHMRSGLRESREVLNGLERIGFLYPQQIIWNKGRAVLTRTHYWYSHEPCAYVRKKNAQWLGKAGENTTIWDSPSPKFIMGGSDEEAFDHPTQKPVELMRRPIRNHLRRGELVYDCFLGSGTTLAAAQLTERVCYGLELDPKYVDVIVARWQSLSGLDATLDGDGRTFAQVKAERVGAE